MAEINVVKIREELNNFGKIKKEFEEFKRLKKELGLKQTMLIDVKRMEGNLEELKRQCKNDR